VKLSVLVPVWNESRTVREVIRRLRSLPIDLEILAIDDGSTDGTWEALRELAGPDLRAFRHPRNRGKGAALRTAIPEARGDYVVVQDGDLEYDPRDLVALLRVAQDENLPVVYGNRAHGRFRKSYQRYYWGGRLLTILTNLLYGTRLHDEPVGYKMFRRDLIQSLPLACEGFDFCPEVTALVSLAGHRVRELPISYAPRSFAEGKKISWRDGLRAIATLVRLRVTGRRRLLRRARDRAQAP
jgi:glycosyltransferase involved in cell wall biosynthesis